MIFRLIDIWRFKVSEKILYDVKDLAGMLGIGVSTIWALVKDNQFIKPFKIAGATKWHKDDIQQWLEVKRKENGSK